MNLFLTLPWLVQYSLLTALGLVAGSFVNWGVYTLAWFPRAISPWAAPPSEARPRTWLDRVPLLGWWRLRREAGLHGSGFWIRPILLELTCAIGFVWLFQYELAGGLLPSILRGAGSIAPLQSILLVQYGAHLLLITLLLVATFIDFDEQTIPDSITIPGTLLGLLLAVLAPRSFLPIAVNKGLFPIDPIQAFSPNAWDPAYAGWVGLAIAVVGIFAWAIALVPTLCTLRRGWWKGLQFFGATFVRGPYAARLLGLATVVALGMTWVWWQGGESWQALFTAMVGLLFGGGLIWAVRIVGQVALRKEAMGFGDVTLMAMIGAFLGWQSALIIFFLSPVAALVVSLGQWLLSGRRDIAFGPYLSLSAVMLIIGWDRIWRGFAADIFSMGSLVPALLGVCLMLMLGLLMLWRITEEFVTRSR